MDAVGRSARDIVHAGLCLEDPQRHVESERIARATAVAIGRHDRDSRTGKRGEGFP